MDDPFLMRVLDGLADLDEQIQTLTGIELVLIAVAGDGDAFDQLHDEVGTTGGEALTPNPSPIRWERGTGHSRIVKLRNAWMVHQRQGLALGFKAGDDLPGVHPQLD